MAQIGNVEIDLSNGGWGGDFSITHDGDLLLAQDALTAPQATFERIARLILTNAHISDANGNPISEADDIYNDSYGASIRAELGQMITGNLIAGLKARILAALATDPGIVQSPAPSISVTAGGNNSIIISGTVWLITGRSLPIPTVIFPVSGTPIITQSAA